MESSPPPSYAERNRNPINRWINNRLDHLTDKALASYVKQYATQPDGTLDEPLAARIRYEVTRRSLMGREIDVLEPGRWTLYSSLLGVASGGAAKLSADALSTRAPVTGKHIQTVLLGTSLASFASAVLTGARILSFARFEAGLYAGAQMAIALHQQQIPAHDATDHLALSGVPKPSVSSAQHSDQWRSRIRDSREAEITNVTR